MVFAMIALPAALRCSAPALVSEGVLEYLKHFRVAVRVTKVLRFLIKPGTPRRRISFEYRFNKQQPSSHDKREDKFHPRFREQVNEAQKPSEGPVKPSLNMPPDGSREIGNLWGSFVTVDDSTYKKCIFDLARVLTSVKRSVNIPSKIVMSHNGDSFEVPISIEVARDFFSLNSDRKLPTAGMKLSNDEASSTCDASDSMHSDELEPCMHEDFETNEATNVGNCSSHNDLVVLGGLLFQERDE
ncbi:hypothetical protein COLO4_38084 [Corchorus olitorius]|uniref:Uncharacterized protein n=1 Tax=Corchorus olitorius TaxID=93759 RepID=A0A1R3FX61_9ROSI|nr:hypothetical protein COLO4_38084 [Corchorus olitorius]